VSFDPNPECVRGSCPRVRPTDTSKKYKFSSASLAENQAGGEKRMRFLPQPAWSSGDSISCGT
jgi:hypothetical protein